MMNEQHKNFKKPLFYHIFHYRIKQNHKFNFLLVICSCAILLAYVGTHSTVEYIVLFLSCHPPNICGSAGIIILAVHIILNLKKKKNRNDLKKLVPITDH